MHQNLIPSGVRSSAFKAELNLIPSGSDHGHLKSRDAEDCESRLLIILPLTVSGSKPDIVGQMINEHIAWGYH